MVEEAKVVLEALRTLTGTNDIYKVIEAEEIIAILPKQMTKQQLSYIIKDLRDREYIKVKYFNPNEYCLLTVNGREDVIERTEEVVEAPVVSAPVKTEKTSAVSSKKAFWMGFLGAFLGGGAVMSIAIVLLQIVFK